MITWIISRLVAEIHSRNVAAGLAGTVGSAETESQAAVLPEGHGS